MRGERPGETDQVGSHAKPDDYVSLTVDPTVETWVISMSDYAAVKLHRATTGNHDSLSVGPYL